MKIMKITNLNDEVTEWCKVEDVLELIDEYELETRKNNNQWRLSFEELLEELKKRITG